MYADVFQVLNTTLCMKYFLDSPLDTYIYIYIYIWLPKFRWRSHGRCNSIERREASSRENILLNKIRASPIFIVSIIWNWDKLQCNMTKLDIHILWGLIPSLRFQLFTCKTSTPSSAKTESLQLKNSPMYSWPTASIISLIFVYIYSYCWLKNRCMLGRSSV